MVVENVDELMVGNVEAFSTVDNLVPEFSSVVSLFRLDPRTLYQPYQGECLSSP